MRSCLVVLSLLLASVQSRCPLDETTEYETYLKGLKLSPNAAPIERVGKIIWIKSTFFVVSIIKIDASLQTVRFGAVLVTEWEDYRVRRNSSRKCSIKMPHDFLWHPHFNILQLTQGAMSVSIGESKLHILEMGAVSHVEPNIFEMICKADTSKFPKDRIICQLDIIMSEHSTVTRFVNAKQIDLESQLSVENSEWCLSNVTTIPTNFTTLGWPSPCLTVIMHLQRNPGYFIAVFVVPNFLLTIVVAFIPLLPINSGERLGLGCSLCLSFVMFLTMLDSAVPKTTTARLIFVIMMSFVLAGLNVVHSIVMAWLLERHCNDVSSVELRKSAWLMQKLVHSRLGDMIFFVFNLLYVAVLIVAFLVIILG